MTFVYHICQRTGGKQPAHTTASFVLVYEPSIVPRRRRTFCQRNSPPPPRVTQGAPAGPPEPSRNGTRDAWELYVGCTSSSRPSPLLPPSPPSYAFHTIRAMNNAHPPSAHLRPHFPSLRSERSPPRAPAAEIRPPLGGVGPAQPGKGICRRHEVPLAGRSATPTHPVSMAAQRDTGAASWRPFLSQIGGAWPARAGSPRGCRQQRNLQRRFLARGLHWEDARGAWESFGPSRIISVAACLCQRPFVTARLCTRVRVRMFMSKMAL